MTAGVEFAPASDRAPERLVRGRMVYRWDLDKTYLRTEFDTVRDILRTAFETPARKRSVPGAPALLRELRDTEPAGIYILSGSPEQMRRVLEAKLRLDGIHWDAFTLKPSLKKIVKGRLRFIRDQVGYKLASLLDSRVRLMPELDEMLFGDDAEADAFVYSLYADLCAGRVGTATLMAVLERARVDGRDVPEIVRLAARLPRRDATRRIFIHLDRISPPGVFAELGRRVCAFHNYFQPALVLLEDGAIDAAAAWRVGADIVVGHRFNPEALFASFLDMVQRGYVGKRAAEGLLAALDDSAVGSLGRALPQLRSVATQIEERLGDLGDPLAAGALEAIDYVGLFSREKARARAARRLAIRRKQPSPLVGRRRRS